MGTLSRKLKEENQRKDRARFEVEERRRLDEMERETRQVQEEQRRQNAVQEGAAQAAQAAQAAEAAGNVGVGAESIVAEQPCVDIFVEGSVTDTELLEVTEDSENVVVPNTGIIGKSRNM